MGEGALGQDSPHMCLFCYRKKVPGMELVLSIGQRIYRVPGQCISGLNLDRMSTFKTSETGNSRLDIYSFLYFFLKQYNFLYQSPRCNITHAHT